MKSISYTAGCLFHLPNHFHKWSLFTLLLFSLIFSITPSAEALESIATYPPLKPGYTSIKVFDREGSFVGRILPERRYWTPIERIPQFLQKAIVAIEDSRFYEHGGIDVRGITRAMVKNVVKRRKAEGGSTITQQLVKNKYLSSEKTFDRKITEGFMAVDLEKNYTKQQILEMYFNEIYYGNGAWGIAQASRIYFDKYPEELTDGECAMLAGVPKNPARYNPLGKPARVTGRRDQVLKRMVDLGMITPEQKKKLRAERVLYAPPGQASYYLSHVRAKLVERLGKEIIELGGLDITAALDLNLQKFAEKTLKEGVKRISPELQGALVSMDSATGDLLAAVGGVDFSKSSYNRSLYAKRQPGSAIKPLIYSAALETGITVNSLWDDTPVAYNRGNNETWTPMNYGKEQRGQLTLREALAYSSNVITVKLLETIGVPEFVTFAARLGLPLKSPNDLSLALGTEEVTLTDLVQAYSPLANNGMRSETRSIIRIFDRRTSSMLEIPPVVTAVLDPANAYLTTKMMQDVMIYGTAKSLKGFSEQHPAAGKTGTTDDYRDAWFIGYTPDVITGIWVGHDKPKPGGKGFTGGGVAAPIWEKFMRQAVASRPVTGFRQPETVVSVTIDPASGFRANADCPEKTEELFIAGTEPVINCTEHGGEPLQPIPSTEAVPDFVGPPLPFQTLR